MTVMEVLNLLLVIFTVLMYLDNHDSHNDKKR